MKKTDPGPDEKKRTNEDEQDVAVNQSTQEHGYDEPAAERKDERRDVSEESKEPSTESVQTSKESFQK